MNSQTIKSLIAYCNQDDPLKEFWLWAQTAGLAIAIAVFECSLFSISNLVVITYTAVMTKLCFMEFNLSEYSAWQDAAGSISLISGLVVALGAAFAKLWLVAIYGSAAVKRNVHLALSLEDTAQLCQSLLPPDASLARGVPVAGQVTLHVELGRSSICTRHLVIRVLSIDSEETAVMIDAVPMLNGQWRLLSAFFSDFGRNKEQVETILSELRPYMSNTRRCVASSTRKKVVKTISYEQVLRESPPRLFETHEGKRKRHFLESAANRL
jgi:hypothetical protein